MTITAQDHKKDDRERRANLCIGCEPGGRAQTVGWSSSGAGRRAKYSVESQRWLGLDEVD
jgi:hypothetical protein